MTPLSLKGFIDKVCVVKYRSFALATISAMYSVQGKVAFVTGALGGIGRSYVKHLLQNGAKGVALVDVNDADWVEFQEELANEFGADKTIFIKVDLRRLDDIPVALDKTVEQFKQLDIIINNAGIVDEQDIESSVQINLAVPALITRLAFTEYLPKYKSDKEAIVVNTSSLAGVSPKSFFPTYSSTKVAVVTLGQCYGQKEHYEMNNIKIMTICPGATETPILQYRLKLPQYFIEIKQKTKPVSSKTQSVEFLGKGLIKVIEEGTTGSVWIVQNEQPPKEVQLQTLQLS